MRHLQIMSNVIEGDLRSGYVIFFSSIVPCLYKLILYYKIAKMNYCYYYHIHT